MPDTVALNAAIDAYAEQSLGSDSDSSELSMERALALDAYAGKNIDEAPEGRSQVNDRTVFESVQQVMPSFMRIFAGGENVVEFDPVGPEDEEVAQQESDYLNYLVTQKNDWELTVREWCQDALITKNAYCMVSMQEKLNTEIESYEGQSEQQIALLLEGDVEVIDGEERIDEDQQGPLIDPTSGQPVPPELQEQAEAIMQQQGIEPQYAPVTVYDVSIRKTTPTQSLMFNVLPPERCRVGQDTKDFTLEDANYFEYWDLVTLSDLRKEGYEIDDDISDDPYNETEEDASRDDGFDTNLEIETPDKSMRQVVVRTIWIRFDYDEDGIAELQKVVRVGREVLEREEITRIPVACIVPFINTHRHEGDSFADLLFEVQRIKTSLLRSGLDSMNLATNNRHAVSDKVNIDDMLISRPGSLVRLSDGAVPGEGHVMPLTTENTFPMAQQGLQHMDTVTEARVGVNRQFSGIDIGTMTGNNEHDAIGQLSTMAAQRVEDVARIFGMGFKRLFSLAHELVIKSGHQAETVRLRGKWTDIDPTQWRTGRDMRVVAPYAAGNKDSLAQRIMIHMQVHEKALQSGLPIVDAQDTYELALMLANATDIPGTKIYTDPSTVEPKEPGPDHTMMALEIENKKADNEAADEERKAQIDVAKVQSDKEVKEFIARLQSETQIALAQIKAGDQVNLEQFKANLKNAPVELGNDLIAQQSEAVSMLNQQVTESIQKISDAMDEMKATSEAPIKIVRKKGKIVGKEVNGKFIPLED